MIPWRKLNADAEGSIYQAMPAWPGNFLYINPSFCIVRIFRQPAQLMRKYIATTSYIILIILINIGFAYTPIFHIWGSEFSLMDPAAGIVYLVRDFAQRELGHRIFVAMVIGSLLSYFLATPAVALASVSAFIAGELIDWSIFTLSKKPLSQRLIWSACISAPIDSLIFISLLGYLSIASFTLMTAGKIIGVCIIWLIWKARSRRLSQAS